MEDDRMMALSKEERIPDRMVDLSKEERIELVLLSGRERWSYRKIAEEFNLRHPYSDKATFYVNGEVNRQNLLYWSRGNPHWMDPSKQQGSKKLMVWCDWFVTCGLQAGQLAWLYDFEGTFSQRLGAKGRCLEMVSSEKHIVFG
ncbi:Hypothetical predicted protein [Octopus vulgaris]|uniref:Uncharacterized protein n=1 Tax=Octopus vulgaris TaxID=6645 RepID=A0AA36FJA1_OCTVU|nr:Hypothetical predicted protein [Octopus vulgaris]